MKTKVISLITVVLVLFTVSCGKYEDGPILSFRGKKVRLEGSWKYQSIIYVDQNITVTDNLPTLVMNFSKDGTYSENTGYEGTWKFSGTVDLNISKTKDTSVVDEKWEIIKLANKQLWLRRDKVEHRFMPE